jgi:hypothetical protein
MLTKNLTNAEYEAVFDLIAETLDEQPNKELFLAKLALCLANEVGDLEKIIKAIEASKKA